ncbi:uncharacterized protein LOC129965411 isoform X3 [Argiope bruennichi]|uniref:uncharacterized protein LOC129965411 isoform X3 n=1 Tax=Argiope bruennichi TaxID=94029 RepID=UPI0024951381|nr:uncharacterized protein LOC129965411 isoform X3 [Argiope bruennichi]
MDWASSQWKQELPPLAIQKINTLEEKIERLQKERQQKQLQCECLELALEKEKHKVENEKQQTIASQREFQSLADLCKDFENKQQRLQSEIQNRDNRITSLEGLLSQAKKENCRLQQLENDLKELRGVREATLLEREQKNGNCDSGQNVKLQETNVNLLSDSLNENSEINISAEKGKNNYAPNENDLLFSLRKKISEQEKVIQELNLKLVSISDKECSKEILHTSANIPDRTQLDSLEVSPALRIKSVWNSFTFTPAKGNKEIVLGHHNDTITTGPVDEKLMALQSRLKQVCQELDCQRHNFEASRISMEQKFKEKENALKVELKYQVQVNSDLNKELKDLRNKYQQEMNLSTKKLDVLTAQLKKTEEVKEILEKELKDMESKTSTCILNLKTKEEEIQDLQKWKNMAETTIQSLQSQVLDVEREYKKIEEQNFSLSETVKAVELQLDSSCNLAQEREANLASTKKELENILVSQKNLLNENQELQNKVMTSQKEIEELLQNETILKEQIELMEKEQSQLINKLNFEVKKSQDLESALEKQNLQISLQKEELSLKESKYTELNTEFTNIKYEYEEKVHDFECKLNLTQKENAELLHQFKECCSRENFLKEKLERTENEKEELLAKLENEGKKLQDIEINMTENQQLISLLKQELSNKSATNNELIKQLGTSKEEFETKIQQLEIKLSTVENEYIGVENKLQECSLTESLLKQKLEQSSTEKAEIVSELTTEKSIRLNLQSSLDELNNQIKLLVKEKACKSSESDELKKRIADMKIEQEEQLNAVLKRENMLVDEIKSLRNERDSLNEELDSLKNEVQKYEAKSSELKLNIHTLNNELCQKSADFDKIQNQTLLSEKEYEEQLNAVLKRENMLVDEIKSLRNERDSLNEELDSLKNEVQKYEAKSSELKLNIHTLNNELCQKSADFDKIQNQTLLSEKEYEARIQDLNAKLSSMNAECKVSQNELKNYLIEYDCIEEKLKLTEENNKKLHEDLNSEIKKSEQLRCSLDELKTSLSNLEEELSLKSIQLEEINEKMDISHAGYEGKIQDMLASLKSDQSKCSLLENQLQEYELNEISLKNKIITLEKEVDALSSRLGESIEENQKLRSDYESQASMVSVLKEELKDKCIQNDQFAAETGNLKKLYEVDVQDLRTRLAVTEAEISTAKILIQNYKENEASLLNKMTLLSAGEQKLTSCLHEEVCKRKNLEEIIEDLKQFIFSFDDDLSHMSEECRIIDQEFLASQDYYKFDVQELEKQLSVLKEMYSTQEAELKNNLIYANDLKEKLKSIEEENTHMSAIIKEQNCRIISLQEANAELHKEILILREQLSSQSFELSDLQKAMEIVDQYKAEVGLENKLPKKFLDSSKELHLSEKMASFYISSFEENLSLKSFEYDELSLENETLKEDFERTIQELHAEIFGIKSENEYLRANVTDAVLNVEMLQKRLELVEKEKKDLDRQLNFENKKIKMLESGIQELKKVILTLQVLLISYNGDIKGLNNETTGSKDYCEYTGDITFTSIPTEKGCGYKSGVEIKSISTFYSPEFKSFSSLPEREFSIALEKYSLYTLNQIYGLENNLISKLESCKFLCCYQLVDHSQLNEMWKIFLFFRKKLSKIQLLKKFMFCFCNILKSSLVAHILHSVNKVALVKVFPGNFGFSLKDFLYLCNNAFNKILFSVSQTFERDSSLVNQHSAFFSNYSNIQSNTFHLPVIKRTGFILYQAKFQRVHWNLKPKHASSKKLDSLFSSRKQAVKKALDALNAPEVPLFLNFTMSLMEKIGKEFCNSSDFTEATSKNFSMSAFQMKNYLSLLEPSSPMLHIVSKYCVDVLNLENIAVHDICYWKHHCNILGIDKCDVQKMITLLEHMDKHKRCERDIRNAKSGDKHTKKDMIVQTSEMYLEQSLKIEKEKQRLLNTAIEEIGRDLRETIREKEKFKSLALDVGKMLVYFKKYDAENCLFSNLHLDQEEFSAETCFCENCVMDEGMSDNSSHEALNLHHCLKWIDKLICAGRRLEEEVYGLKINEDEQKSLYEKLKDKNSELEMTVDMYNRKLETIKNEMQNVTYDLQKQKERYENLSQSVIEKDMLNMQLETENTKLLDSIDEYKTKLNIWEEKISSLSVNQEKLECSLLCKDTEIASLKATLDENSCQLNETQLKCEKYRNEIHLLNSRISKYEEEKIIDQHMLSHSFDNSSVPDDLVKTSKTIINELQAKVDSLTKSNNSLLLTIENIEEELKNVYMEKQRIIEELGSLSEHIVYFKQEISVSAQKYNDEKKINKDLLLKLKEYEKLMLDNEYMINQLKIKEETLEKNAILLKTVTKEHEQVVSKKNSDLSRCHQIIEQLQKQITELDKENSNLKVQTKVVDKQECLKHQLNELMFEKSQLEKEIKRLKLIETEKEKIMRKLSEANFQRNDLTEQFHHLKMELETQKEKSTCFEIKCTELSRSLTDAISSNTSLEKELNKNKNLISNLIRQLEESSTELKKVKNINCELTKEIANFKSREKQLTQEIETLSKNLKDVMDKVKAEYNRNQSLMRENETLKMNDNAHSNISGELQKLRNTLKGACHFITNILNIILCAVQSYPESTDFEELRLSLLASVVHWTHNSEKEFETDVFDQLGLFFGALINNHKDDMEICQLISIIKDSIKEVATIGDSCQGVEASLVISPDTMSNMSVFESTFIKQRNSHSQSVLADLQYIKTQTNEVIFNFKNIILKKTEEIEELKKELKQHSSTSVKNESKPMELDKNFKWKYELIKRQYRQLEEKYSKIVISSEQMEQTIKKLAEQNRNLEEEAEDLSKDIKNMQTYYSNSDELLDALTELNALRHKLKGLENENNWLKKGIQEFQLQQTSTEKSSSCSLRQTQIPKFDRTCLKENNTNRLMK